MEFSVNERIVKLLSVERLEEAEFARKLGLVRADKIYNIVKKKTGVSTEMIQLILIHFPNLNTDWLVLGTEPMYKQEDNKGQVYKQLEELTNKLQVAEEKVAYLTKITQLMEEKEQLKNRQ